MIFFDTKHRLPDISGFARGDPDFYLHCLSDIFGLQWSLSDIFGLFENLLDWPPRMQMCLVSPLGYDSRKAGYVV